MQFHLNQHRLLNASHTLKDKLAEKHIKRPNGKAVGQQACLEFICQSLFNKPYAEVKALIEKQDEKERAMEAAAPSYQGNAQPKVFIFHYGVEAVLAQVIETGENAELELAYVRCRGTGTDIEISLSEILNQARNLAKSLNTDFCEIKLPEILADDWEYEDILTLAAQLGYLKQTETLLDVMTSDMDLKVFIDGLHCPYMLNGDWETSVQDIYQSKADGDTDEDPMKQCIWYPEMMTADGDLYECFFSLADIARATALNPERTKWILIEDDGTSHQIEVYINHSEALDTSPKALTTIAEIEAVFDKRPVYSAATGQQLHLVVSGFEVLLLAHNIDTEEDYTLDLNTIHGEIDEDMLTIMDEDATVELTFTAQ